MSDLPDVYHTTLVQKSGHVHPVDQAVLQQSQLISKRVSESKNAVAFSLGPTVALSKRFIAYIKGRKIRLIGKRAKGTTMLSTNSEAIAEIALGEDNLGEFLVAVDSVGVLLAWRLSDDVRAKSVTGTLVACVECSSGVSQDTIFSIALSASLPGTIFLSQDTAHVVVLTLTDIPSERTLALREVPHLQLGLPSDVLSRAHPRCANVVGVTDLAVSPNSEYMAASLFNGLVVVWSLNLPAGKFVFEQVAVVVEDSLLFSVHFLSDNLLLVGGPRNESLSVWQIPGSGKPLVKIQSLSFAHEGADTFIGQVAVCSQAESVLLTDMRNLTLHIIHTDLHPSASQVFDRVSSCGVSEPILSMCPLVESRRSEGKTLKVAVILTSSVEILTADFQKLRLPPIGDIQGEGKTMNVQDIFSCASLDGEASAEVTSSVNVASFEEELLQAGRSSAPVVRPSRNGQALSVSLLEEALLQPPRSNLLSDPSSPLVPPNSHNTPVTVSRPGPLFAPHDEMDYGSPVSLVDVAKSDSTVASEGEQAGVKEDIPVSAEVLRRDLGDEDPAAAGSSFDPSQQGDLVGREESPPRVEVKPEGVASSSTAATDESVLETYGVLMSGVEDWLDRHSQKTWERFASEERQRELLQQEAMQSLLDSVSSTLNIHIPEHLEAVLSEQIAHRLIPTMVDFVKSSLEGPVKESVSQTIDLRLQDRSFLDSIRSACTGSLQSFLSSRPFASVVQESFARVLQEKLVPRFEDMTQQMLLQMQEAVEALLRKGVEARLGTIVRDSIKTSMQDVNSEVQKMASSSSSAAVKQQQELATMMLTLSKQLDAMHSKLDSLSSTVAGLELRVQTTAGQGQGQLQEQQSTLLSKLERDGLEVAMEYLLSTRSLDLLEFACRRIPIKTVFVARRRKSNLPTALHLSLIQQLCFELMSSFESHLESSKPVSPCSLSSVSSSALSDVPFFNLRLEWLRLALASLNVDEREIHSRDVTLVLRYCQEQLRQVRSLNVDVALAGQLYACLQSLEDLLDVEEEEEEEGEDEEQLML